MRCPIAYTASDGGKWRAIADIGSDAVAAVLFDSGLIFDYKLFARGFNPWRKNFDRARIRIRASTRSLS